MKIKQTILSLAIAMITTLAAVCTFNFYTKLQRPLSPIIHKDGLYEAPYPIATTAEAFFKKHPFLKESRKKTIGIRESIVKYAKEIKIQTINFTHKETSTRFLIIHLVGPPICGAIGCAFYIFRDTGEGFKQAAYAIHPPTSYILKKGKDVSFLIEGVHNALDIEDTSGWGEWPLEENGAYIFGDVLQGRTPDTLIKTAQPLPEN